MMSKWRSSPAFLWLFVMAATTVGSWAARARHKPVREEDFEITCFTCVNVSNNYSCNRLAVDRPCPKGTDYCHTLHILDSDGTSVLVNKKCAKRNECRPVDVGCFTNSTKPGLMKCVACCDLQYCNEFIPTNESTAILISTRISNEASPLLQRVYHWVTVCLLLFVHAVYHHNLAVTGL